MIESTKQKSIRIASGVMAASMLFLSCASLTACKKDPEDSDGKGKGDGSVTAPQGTVDKVEVTMEEHPSLRITELMVVNTVGITDKDGKRSGWLEIQNCGSDPVQLSEYSMALGNGEKVSLPDKTLKPGEYTVIFASGKQSSDSVGFTLTVQGVLLIYHGDLCTDKVEYYNGTANYSYVRETGGETAEPTPGGESAKEKDSLVISELMSTNDLYPIDGALCDWIELLNTGENDIDLSGFYASNSYENRYGCQLPEKVLKPGEYIVLACGRDLTFNLSKDSDKVFITRSADGVIVTSRVYDEPMEKNTAWTYDRGTVNQPSPGQPNTEEGWLIAIGERKGLLISEVISSNSKIAPVNGECYDMVELWNNSDSAINLSDYYLSDKSGELQRYRLPEGTLNPGEYTVVYCDGSNYAPFKISSSGEKLYVSDGSGKVIDALKIPKIPANYSWGRYDGKLVYFTTTSFGKANPEGNATITAVPLVSAAGGFYDAALGVTLSGEGNIYYTLDGSKPDRNSTLYQGETIQIQKTASLRVVAFDGSKIPCEVKTYDYFISEPSYSLPVVKISIKDSDFYGEKTGIYTNYNKDMEKEIGLSYYVNGEAAFSVNCGLKVFGASSRQYAKKSYQLKFRSEYGMSELKYKIFDDLDIDSFNSLVLRSGSQSMMKYRTMMTDELVTSMAAKSGNMPGLLVQAYKPVDLYINSEYMGVYFLREKIDDDFVASHWGVSPESVTVINWVNTVKYGASDQGWHDIWDYVFEKKTDLSVEANYKWVADQLDLESLADVYIMRMWGGDRDSGNIRAVKSPEYDGGKWHFMLFDCDLCFDVRTTQDEVEYIMTNSNLNRLHGIFRAMMKNTSFRDYFLERLGYHLKNTLTPEKAQARLDAIYNEILPDMPYNIERWKASYHPDVATWQAQYNALRRMIGDQRIGYFVKDTVKTFKLSADDVKRLLGEEFVELM